MKTHSLLGLCLVSVLLLSGCRGLDPEDAVAQANETNIQRLANLYFTYQMKNGWQGPKDEQSFKEFIRSFDAGKLSRIGIDATAIDELFVNPRDEQPFKIRYGVPGSAMGSAEAVIFETEGKKGKRLVGFLNMQQREVEETEYEALWSGKAAPAAPQRQIPAGNS